MKEIAKEKRPVPARRDGQGRREGSGSARLGYALKVPHVDEIPEDVDLLLRLGRLHRHVRGARTSPTRGWLENVKLLSVSGAYWRGDAKGVPMQRVHGTAFFTAEALGGAPEARRGGEAPRPPQDRPRDGPLLVPRRGARARCSSTRRAWCSGTPSSSSCARSCASAATARSRTPMVLTDELWKRSGHWDHFKDAMYFLEVDERNYAVKPMNCPGCCLVYGRTPKSLPRPAAAPRGVRPRLPPRALGRAHGRDARAHLHPGRRARLLHPRADAGRDRRHDRPRPDRLPGARATTWPGVGVKLATRPANSMGSARDVGARRGGARRRPALRRASRSRSPRARARSTGPRSSST